MKQLFGFACAAMLLVGCTKEEASPSAGGKSSTTSIAKSGGGLTFFDVNGNAGCDGDPCDCIGGVVIVKPESVHAVDDVFAAIATGNRTTIVNAFTAEFNVLSEFMSEDDLSGVIDETLSVRSRMTNPNANRYMILEPVGGGKIVTAYQILCIR